jgi:hypothetical protein
MLPPEIAPDTRSPAERSLFGRFRDELDGSWTVLHSLNIRNHATKPWAEIDFVAVGPSGIVCIEVKGGIVAQIDGKWVFTDQRGNSHTRNEGPFDQAGSASAALRNDLADHFPAVKQGLVGWGVMTPDCILDADRVDILREVLYDGNSAVETVPKFIERVMTHWTGKLGRRRPLAPSDIRQIVEYLRGDFEARPDIRHEIKLTNATITELTVQQGAFLRSCRENPFILCKGAAGTGKTVLAIDEARRLGSEGNRVLFVCFNRALASHLKLQDWAGCDVEVTTVSAFIRRAALQSSEAATFPDGPDNLLYSRYYPLAAVGVLLNAPQQFDALVIDEAQDVFAEETLDALEAAVGGDFATATLRIFMDAQQDIYKRLSPSAEGRINALNPARIVLDLNCRNTTTIAYLTSIASRTPLPETRIEEGHARNHFFSNSRDQQSQISTRVHELLERGVHVDDIIILGPRRLENSSFSDATVAGRHVVGLETDRPQGGIRYSTIHSFKGLESNVVILADIDDLSSDEARQLVYVGCTRAKAILDIYIADSQKETWADLSRDFAGTMTSSR